MRHPIRTLSPLLLLAACVAPREVAAPPASVPVPVVVAIAPRTTDWRDIPLTAGDWSYAPAPGGSEARFGRHDTSPEFIVHCDMAHRSIMLLRVAGGAGTMAITTSAGDRALAGTAVTGPVAGMAATLPARDPYLDRMAFSRGRFVVAVTGTGRLVIPAWPEFARVVEDCRG